MVSKGVGGAHLKTAFAFGLVAILVVFLFWLRYIVLLSFLGLLLGILLDAMARFEMRWLRLPRVAAVVVAAVIFVVGVLGTLGLLAVPLVSEGTALVQSLPQRMSQITRTLDRYEQEFPWLRRFLPSTRPEDNPPGQARPLEMAKTALFTVSTALEWSADALAAFFLGLFLAWDPERWLQGVARLWPGNAIDRRIALLRQMGSALRSYLFTLAVYIVAMGSLWTLGLWLIGIDYPLLFGVIGGLVEVVPYLGPLIALIPPLLYALTVEPLKAIYVVLLYTLLHIVEGYILVPYLLHEREHLPPPLVVLSILAFGTLFGPLGVILSVPLGIVGYVWVVETVYRSRELAPSPQPPADP